MKIYTLFKSKNINLEKEEERKMDKEFSLIVTVPSVIGQMRYFCKAKNKKRCDEKDLSSAVIEAQLARLPLLFIYTGELAKKAQDIAKTSVLENAILLPLRK